MKTLLRLALLAVPAVLLNGQAVVPQFPSNIAGDNQLKVAANDLVTKLILSAAAGDTALSLADASRVRPNMLLTIDGGTPFSEVVSVVSIAGNSVTVVRGFDGTAASVHAAGRPVAANIDAWHHAAMAAEVQAIEMALGPNLVNVQNPPAAAALYTFSVSPTSALIGGVVNQVTLTPCPRGVSGTDVQHAIAINGGAETVTVQGGSCANGAASGTLLFTPAGSYAPGYTLSSATGGLQESICVLPAAGGAAQLAGVITLLANVSGCGKANVTVHRAAGTTVNANGFKILGNTPAATTEQAEYTSGPTAGNAVTHFSFLDASPNLMQINGNWNLVRATVGNAAANLEFGSGSGYPTVSAVTGATDASVSGGDTWTGQAMGVQGVVRGGKGPNVGVFGNCVADRTPTGGCWGANFVTNGIGIYTNLWGIETDVNIGGKPITAPASAYGNTVVSAAYQFPQFEYFGFSAEKAESPLHQHFPFRSAFRAKDGAGQTGMDIGAIYLSEPAAVTFATLPAPTRLGTIYYCSDCNAGFGLAPAAAGGAGGYCSDSTGAWLCVNANASQGIQLHGYDTARVIKNGGIAMDGFGNTTVFGAPNALVQFAHGLGNAAVTITGDNGIVLPGVTFANLGYPLNGKLQFCSNCSVAPTCSAGGTGAFAKALNTTWTCN